MDQSTKKKMNNSLLKIIVCPITKGPLVWDRKKNELISRKAKLAYPIIEGIPILIKENARKIKWFKSTRTVILNYEGILRILINSMNSLL